VGRASLKSVELKLGPALGCYSGLTRLQITSAIREHPLGAGRFLIARILRVQTGTGVRERSSTTEEEMAKKARDVVSPDAQCIGEDDSVAQAAQRLAELGVGAMPICGNDDRLKGVLTDRDIVVEVLAQGKDPDSTKARELGAGKPVTIGADDSLGEALQTMKAHAVRRLPVIDGHDLVGIVSIADLAQNIDDEETGDLVEAISAAP
jgi:CBS domain-containing protein